MATQGLPTDAKEIGTLAAWSVSSHKYGYGVECLQDSSEDVFWQSEGPQPHSISLQFPHLMQITKVALLLSHVKDDSYTPQKISVQAGTGKHDLTEVTGAQFEKPEGWQTIDLRDAGAGGEGEEDEGEPIGAFLVKILIVANHMSGKDTHVRGVKIFGPKPSTIDVDTDDYPFSSLEFKMHAALR